ncbi:MAG: polymer-forming cytoskeletal protein [Asticcacaulis sp.]|nr:polymer-forming cytoskeletal protein [Asticcacaulis sp.]
MFNKTNKPARADTKPAAPATVAPPLDAPSVNLNKTTPVASQRQQSAKPFSSVGSGLVIDGSVTGSGDLHLDGTVKGDVRVNHLTVGESGSIEGKVEAETIEVRGRIVGSIQGKQVKLQATAYVEGDITHEQLAIDVGAYFQGRCLQRRPESVQVNTGIATPADSAVAAPAPGGMNSYDMSVLSDLA